MVNDLLKEMLANYANACDCMRNMRTYAKHADNEKENVNDKNNEKVNEKEKEKEKENDSLPLSFLFLL